MNRLLDSLKNLKDTLPKFNIGPEKLYAFPIGKWSSNHHFSGAMLNFGEVMVRK